MARIRIRDPQHLVLLQLAGEVTTPPHAWRDVRPYFMVIRSFRHYVDRDNEPPERPVGRVGPRGLHLGRQDEPPARRWGRLTSAWGSKWRPAAFVGSIAHRQAA